MRNKYSKKTKKENLTVN